MQLNKQSMTEKICAVLDALDKRVLKSDSPKLVRLYLLRPNMWNAALVEGTGWTIYSIILSFTHTNLLLSLVLPVPLSFMSKYFIYNRWLFKAPTQESKP